jgi:hypothetical protein
MNESLWRLEHLDDQQLLASMHSTLAQGRKHTAQLIAHLSEVETRRLHLRATSRARSAPIATRIRDIADRPLNVARTADGRAVRLNQVR